MKEIVPPPPAIVHNETAEVQSLFHQYVVPSYGRFDLVFSHGSGSRLWDVAGKSYLDFGGGIAVCALGHAPAAITDALIEQSRKLVHVSNLYYQGPQGRLARALVDLIGPGKCFFCNSGAEANEGLFKLARKFGHDEGRFEIITALNSFHGRTLAGIAATGQEKVKKGFEPAMPGFRHVPYNDLNAVRNALSPATAAVMIEGIQGEGGVTPATPAYLLGLRQLCDEKKLLLLMDEVQCGYFRTGKFHSYQRILEGVPGGGKFIPDGVSMAKSLGGGFPIGAFWVRRPYADLLGAGTHASTFGGTPLACAVALKILEVVHRENLADNARAMVDFLNADLQRIAQKYPAVIQNVRGLGLMLGLELAPNIPALGGEGKSPAARFTNLLHAAGLLAIPAGANVIRFLPALNLSRGEAAEGLKILESVIAPLAG
ncbi:MAG TPA: acetylornithine/succinylornithine family transaminase [Verrucomicrobiae bacterium]|jgi:acetylornithine aminotransferase/acetylornithine/N-succinyldiaminopimelate aminotransferase|nr:acetylornithine/succinylornithine family transaminase [Verrucomicrobiae bacterium]